MPTESLAYLFKDEPWRERAKCRELEMPVAERVALFFPDRGGSQRLAKATCARCPVKVECDQYRNDSKSEYGIWGGEISHRSGQYPRPEETTHGTQDPVSE